MTSHQRNAILAERKIRSAERRLYSYTASDAEAAGAGLYLLAICVIAFVYYFGLLAFLILGCIYAAIKAVL